MSPPLCVMDRFKPWHAAKKYSPIKAPRMPNTQLHKLKFLMRIRLHRGMSLSESPKY